VVTQGGILTEACASVYSVVLLDEVEKAHRDVMNLFYQVFDRGFMRDGEGREIDFRNTVILMTSNLGSTICSCWMKPEAREDLHELLPNPARSFQPRCWHASRRSFTVRWLKQPCVPLWK
jgi:type VI secretion system protein VasG